MSNRDAGEPKADSSIFQSLLTSEEHSCGAPIYKVGSDRERFCARCRTKVEQ